MKRVMTITVMIAAAVVAASATDYTFLQCEGSLTPYPEISGRREYPDSLRPVFISHVGRHGARYPASSSHCSKLRRVLRQAKSLGTITPLGRRLDTLNNEIMNRAAGRWGALDSLGQAEQAAIAARMYLNYPQLFAPGSEVNAISSYVPRCIDSMEAFLAELRTNQPEINIAASSGEMYDSIVRPFQINQAYLTFRADNLWEPPYASYYDSVAPLEPIRRVLGDKFPFKNDAEARELSLIEYYVLAGCNAMSMTDPMPDFLTATEVNALWSCFNLRQYLQRTASMISSIPADIAAPLARNIIEDIDNFISHPDSEVKVSLRFGHAETIMPLVSLLNLPGCRYLTDDYSTVGMHWRDFDIVPMASNVQFILFRAEDSGRHYLRILLNESPVRLHPDDTSDLYPWPSIRSHLLSLLPSPPHSSL